MKLKNLKLKYVIEKKGGYYWNPPKAYIDAGFPHERRALGRSLSEVIPDAEALNADLASWRAGREVSFIKRGTIKWLFNIYRESPEYKALRPKTREGYDWHLNLLEVYERKGIRLGDIQASSVLKPHAKTVYNELKESRGLYVANYCMKTARTVYNWAKGELTEFTGVENPFSALRLKSPPGRDVVWTEDQVRAMAAKAVEMGRPSIALAVRVAYETFQRATDNLQLRRDQYRDGAFLIRQSKTGTAVRIPIADRELCAAVEAVTSEYLFVSESTGRPYAEPHFRYWFKKIKKAAGLPKELQFRDNRRSTLTELGDAGATDDEIRAASGHLSREVVAKYVKRTNVQAQNAVNKRQIFRISQKGVSELKVIDGGKLLAAK